MSDNRISVRLTEDLLLWLDSRGARTGGVSRHEQARAEIMQWRWAMERAKAETVLPLDTVNDLRRLAVRDRLERGTIIRRWEPNPPIDFVTEYAVRDALTEHLQRGLPLTPDGYAEVGLHVTESTGQEPKS